MLCESLFALLLSSVLCSVTSLFILKSVSLQGSSMRKQTSPRSPFIPFTPIQQFVKFCLPTTFSFSWLASGSGLLWGFRSRVRGGSPGAGVWGVGWGNRPEQQLLGEGSRISRKGGQSEQPVGFLWFVVTKA